MKFFAVLASLALAVASTHAADCTVQTITDVQSKPEFVALQSACGASASAAASSTTVDAGLKKMCDDKTCLTALEAALKVVPDCSISGVSFKKQFEDQYANVQAQCKKVADGATNASTREGASSASTFATASAAATIAVVAVFAQL